MKPTPAPWVKCVNFINGPQYSNSEQGSELWNSIARVYGPEGEANARLIITACNSASEINPDNPIAAAEALPEIWRLINHELPIIGLEADTRDTMGFEGDDPDLYQYYSEMRDLVLRIEALITKATAREAA